MSTNPTLTVSVNGGPPQTGAVYVSDGDTLNFGVVNRDGWLSARWELTDYPDGFACPAGWSTGDDDATRPMYYVVGTANPPTVTSSGWGPYKSRIIVNNVDVDERTFVKILSPSGFEAQAADEEGQFGGTKLQKDKAYNANLVIFEAIAAAAIGTATVDPDPDTLALRGPSGEGKFTALQADELVGQTDNLTVTNTHDFGLKVTDPKVRLSGDLASIEIDTDDDTIVVDTQASIALAAGTTIAIGSTAGTTVTAGTDLALAATAGTASFVAGSGSARISGSAGAIDLQRAAVTGATITVHPTGAFSVAPVPGATSVTYQQAAAASGIGVAAVYGAQAGFAGSIGGYTQVGANNGGTPGTNLAGGVRAELGTLVANQSAKLSLRANGTEFAYLRQQGASSETILSSAGALDLDSATSVVNLMANGAASVIWTLSASGAVALAPVGGVASLTVQPAQKTSGAGAAVTVAGGQGSSGNAGGKTTVGANNGAIPGTNLAGGVDVQLGATVTAASAPLTVLSDATTVVSIAKTASASAEVICPGLLYMHGASGCLIGSNDDSVRVECSQSSGFVTAKGTNGGVRLQDTNVTWCEVSRVAVGRNVVGLAVGANLDTTKMPANTGNGVVFIGNAGTAPTADPNSTGAILWCETQQIRVRANTVYDEVTSLLSNTGGTASQAVVHSKRDYTLTTTAVTADQVIGALTLLGAKGGARIKVSYLGYDTSGDGLLYAERLYRVKDVSGTLTLSQTDTIGTDSLGGGSVSAAISGAAVQFRVTPGSAANTRWSAHVESVANYIG